MISDCTCGHCRQPSCSLLRCIATTLISTVEQLCLHLRTVHLEHDQLKGATNVPASAMCTIWQHLKQFSSMALPVMQMARNASAQRAQSQTPPPSHLPANPQQGLASPAHLPRPRTPKAAAPPLGHESSGKCMHAL